MPLPIFHSLQYTYHNKAIKAPNAAKTDPPVSNPCFTAPCPPVDTDEVLDEILVTGKLVVPAGVDKRRLELTVETFEIGGIWVKVLEVVVVEAGVEVVETGEAGLAEDDVVIEAEAEAGKVEDALLAAPEAVETQEQTASASVRTWIAVALQAPRTQDWAALKTDEAWRAEVQRHA